MTDPDPALPPEPEPEPGPGPGSDVEPAPDPADGPGIEPGPEPVDDAGPGTAPGGGARGAPPGLTERERAVLAFEHQWWRTAGAKEQAVRDRFGLSATRYYQILNALIDRDDALAAEPVLVGRLRRLRASRQRARKARRLDPRP